MRKAALWLSLVACIAFVGSMLLADENPAAGTEKAAKNGRKVAPDGLKNAAKKDARLGDLGTKMDKAVGGFSDDQKPKIADLNKAREAELKKINDKFQADVVALMTEEQKTKWEEALKETKKADKGAAKAGKGGLDKGDAVKNAGPNAGDTGAPKEGGDAAK
jgi:hypothetical protein